MSLTATKSTEDNKLQSKAMDFVDLTSETSGNSILFEDFPLTAAVKQEKSNSKQIERILSTRCDQNGEVHHYVKFMDSSIVANKWVKESDMTGIDVSKLINASKKRPRLPSNDNDVIIIDDVDSSGHQTARNAEEIDQDEVNKITATLFANKRLTRSQLHRNEAQKSSASSVTPTTAPIQPEDFTEDFKEPQHPIAKFPKPPMFTVIGKRTTEDDTKVEYHLQWIHKTSRVHQNGWYTRKQMDEIQQTIELQKKRSTFPWLTDKNEKEMLKIRNEIVTDIVKNRKV